MSSLMSTRTADVVEEGEEYLLIYFYDSASIRLADRRC